MAYYSGLPLRVNRIGIGSKKNRNLKLDQSRLAQSHVFSSVHDQSDPISQTQFRTDLTQFRTTQFRHRKLKILEGRLLAHGEEETGKRTGRHYLLLEGTDAQVHLIYYTPEMEEARSRGKLRANSFVRLQKQFENGRPVLEIEDSGDAERVLKDKQRLGEAAKGFLAHGIVPSTDGWGGWLGRYQAAVTEVARKAREKSRLPRDSGHVR